MTVSDSSYILFLDDERWPEQVTWVRLPTYFRNHWTIVRSYDEFVQCIESKGLPKFITFDHDLAEEHYKSGIAGTEPTYDQYKTKTGYECAKWLVDYCNSTNQRIPSYEVHSMSPVGRDNIRKVLADYAIDQLLKSGRSLY